MDIPLSLSLPKSVPKPAAVGFGAVVSFRIPGCVLAVRCPCFALPSSPCHCARASCGPEALPLIGTGLVPTSHEPVTTPPDLDLLNTGRPSPHASCISGGHVSSVGPAPSAPEASGSRESACGVPAAHAGPCVVSSPRISSLTPSRRTNCPMTVLVNSICAMTVTDTILVKKAGSPLGDRTRRFSNI